MTYRSKNPQHRIAVLGAALMAIATDLQAATSGSKGITCFDADKDFTAKSNVGNGASNMAATSPMSVHQHQVDIAGAAPAHRHAAAKKARTFEIDGLGSSANGTCIGIDGAGSASAPAVKTAIGSGEALGVANDEAVVDFGASCEGMAPMALVAAASAKKAFGSARRRA
jgi:hypothetical protein